MSAASPRTTRTGQGAERTMTSEALPRTGLRAVAATARLTGRGPPLPTTTMSAPISAATETTSAADCPILR